MVRLSLCMIDVGGGDQIGIRSASAASQISKKGIFAQSIPLHRSSDDRVILFDIPPPLLSVVGSGSIS